MVEKGMKVRALYTNFTIVRTSMVIRVDLEHIQNALSRYS